MAVVLSYLCCAIVWGTTWFAIRVCIAPGGYPVVAGAALRFTIAAALLIVINCVCKFGPGIGSRRQRQWIAGAGLLNGVGYALVYTGETSVSGAFASILFGTMPLMVAFLAAITKTEPISRGQVIGSCFALVGISVIFWERLSVSVEQGVGVAFILLAVAASAGYSLILKREGGATHPLRTTSWFLTVTAIALWLVAMVTGAVSVPLPLPLNPTIALLYLAIAGSVLTFACYLYLLQNVSLMTVMTLVFVQPIIAVIVDIIWEDASFSLYTFLGMALTMSGVLTSILVKQTKPEGST